MGTKIVTDDSFQADVIGSDRPVLVDFWAEWCGPCRMIAPALEEISRELGEKVTIVKANLDDAGDAASRYNVRTIPQLVLFKGGAEAARWSRGAAPKSVLQTWLEEQLEAPVAPAAQA
ncbi:MAG TPA: thioredoxin [Allosphingosinicella sp.]|nr:thioredoxin [Allosphingosinicella sp.]